MVCYSLISFDGFVHVDALPQAKRIVEIIAVNLRFRTYGDRRKGYVEDVHLLRCEIDYDGTFLPLFEHLVDHGDARGQAEAKNYDPTYSEKIIDFS